MPHDPKKVLQHSLAKGSKGASSSLSEEVRESIKKLVSQACGNQKNLGVLTVLITLLTKKVISPEQDIRRHQAKMPGGFSGRGLDSDVITPFLREQHFPHMAQSGWLTRSLEQPQPYNRDYPGKIQPAWVKECFLSLLDTVENVEKNVDKKSTLAQECLGEIFSKLTEFRDQSTNVALSKPKNKSIGHVVTLLEEFWNQSTPNASRVPVIAIFAAYECLVAEVNRYKGHKLLPLLSHTSADSKTGRIGDVDLQVENKTVEAVEVKHNISIAPVLVQAAIEKVKRTTVKRYYILSTKETISNLEEVTNLTTDARANYGCEIIANGVGATLKYYLRLLANPDQFINHFVDMLEHDQDIGYATKQSWDKVVDRQNVEE